MGPIWPACRPARSPAFNFRGIIFPNRDPEFDLDLANGVSDSILDPISRLLQTLLYRKYRRRAHHLSPDPNIFNGQTQQLKFWHFSGFGKLIILGCVISGKQNQIVVFSCPEGWVRGTMLKTGNWSIVAYRGTVAYQCVVAYRGVV